MKRQKKKLELSLRSAKMGKSRWCGPSALSIITGYNTTVTRTACKAVGTRVVKGVATYDLVAAAELLNYRLEVQYDKRARAAPTFLRWHERYRRRLEAGATYVIAVSNHWRVVKGDRIVCGWLDAPIKIGDDSDPFSNRKNGGKGFGWRARVRICIKVHPRDKTPLDYLAEKAGLDSEADLLEAWREISQSPRFRRRRGSLRKPWDGKVARPLKEDFESLPEGDRELAHRNSVRAAKRQLARLDLYRNGPKGRMVDEVDGDGNLTGGYWEPEREPKVRTYKGKDVSLLRAEMDLPTNKNNLPF